MSDEQMFLKNFISQIEVIESSIKAEEEAEEDFNDEDNGEEKIKKEE